MAIESRGFIFGAPVAAALRIGFVPVRKPGKLPFRIASRSYALEYGSDTLEIDADAVVEGARVAIVDDLLATGGTAHATLELVRELGGEVAVLAFAVELGMLRGRERLAGDADRVAAPLLMPVRGRFAPSPPASFTSATRGPRSSPGWTPAARGAFLMRIEDLDRARVQPDAEAQQLAELAWLGLDWDEGPDRGGPFAPYRQSERTARYDAAIERLLASKRAFLCACSRADVARAASAPHDDAAAEPRYPGTCRDANPAAVVARAAAQGRARPCGSRAAASGSTSWTRFTGRWPARRAASTTSSCAAPTAPPRTAGRGGRRRSDEGDARRAGRRSLALDAAADRALPRARADSAGLCARSAGGHPRRRAAGEADPPGVARLAPRAGRGARDRHRRARRFGGPSCARPAAAGGRAGRRILAAGGHARARGRRVP